MWESIFGVAFAVVVITLIVAVVLGYFLNGILLVQKIRNFIRRRIPVQEMPSDLAGHELKRIDPALSEMLKTYFQSFNDPRKYSKHTTASFIREVYYATFQIPIQEIKADKMVKELTKTGKNGAALKAYRLLEVVKAPSGEEVIVRLWRRWSSRGEDEIRYISKKVDGQWKMAHIARMMAGEVLERLETERIDACLIGNEEGAMVFVDPVEGRLHIGDQVVVWGYLETQYHLHGNFFYHIVDLEMLSAAEGENSVSAVLH